MGRGVSRGFIREEREKQGGDKRGGEGEGGE